MAITMHKFNLAKMPTGSGKDHHAIIFKQKGQCLKEPYISQLLCM